MGEKVVTPRSGATALEALGDTDLTGRHFLITGANQGIGFETARALALHNGTITMACRNLDAANAAKEKIEEEEPGAVIHVIELDLSDLYSVEQCAKDYKKTGRPLHCLILNAGVFNPAHRVTDAGFEATFQINHLAQFYLTKLLMETLLRSAPARVVIVSSSAQQLHRSLKVEDVTWERFSPTHSARLNGGFTAYGLSKLANVMFAAELHRRYAAHGVAAFSLHPGVIDTGLSATASGVFGVLKLFAKPFYRSHEQGAATSVYCATCAGLEGRCGGAFLDDFRPRTPAPPARSPAVCARLWALSDQMLAHYVASANQRDAELAAAHHLQPAVGPHKAPGPHTEDGLSAITEEHSSDNA